MASGTGQHSAHFAAALPHLTILPTEQALDPGSAESIAAWAEGLPNVLPPAALDASAPPASWPVEAGSCGAVFAANICHIRWGASHLEAGVGPGPGAV